MIIRRGEYRQRMDEARKHGEASGFRDGSRIVAWKVVRALGLKYGMDFGGSYPQFMADLEVVIARIEREDVTALETGADKRLHGGE